MARLGGGGSRTGRRTQASHPMPRVVRLKHCARQPLVSARHFPHVRLPSSPLHKQARPAGAGGDEARGGRRSVAWYLCSHDAEAACRSRAPGRIVWRAWSTPCPRLVVVWSAPTGAAFAAPPSSRATPTAELCAPGARALGRQSGRHRRRDQREERRGQHEPHIALSAHLHTRHSPLTDDLRHPTSHLTGGARRLSGQDGSSAAVRQLTTSTGVLRHRPRRGWRLALSLRSPAPPSAGMLGWGGRGVAGGAGWPTAWPLATRLGWARGL